MTSLNARLNPTFDPNPTALIAWDGISGLWYAELQGVPTPDFVSTRHETWMTHSNGRVPTLPASPSRTPRRPRTRWSLRGIRHFWIACVGRRSCRRLTISPCAMCALSRGVTYPPRRTVAHP